MIDLLLGIPCFLVLLYGVSVIVGVIAFAPLQRADKLRHTPWQFQISDFLVLLAQLQIVFGLALTLLRPSVVLEGLVLALVVSLVMIGWWLSGVRLLSKAKIDEVPLRLIFLGLVAPVGYGLSLVIMVGPAILLVHAGAAVDLIISGGQSGGSAFAMMTGIEVVVVVGMIACRRTSAWIVDRSQTCLQPDR